MHVDVRKAGDVVILDLSGKLSAGLGDQILRDTLDELFAGGWKKLLLNLSEVSFMDSAGVGELVAGLKTARNLGARLKLLNANERVHSTLFISKLLPIFELYDGEPEALASFSLVAARGGHSSPHRGSTLVGSLETTLQLHRTFGAMHGLPHVQLVAIQLQVRLALRALGHI